jgi:hypothetical protein
MRKVLHFARSSIQVTLVTEGFLPQQPQVYHGNSPHQIYK